MYNIGDSFQSDLEHEEISKSTKLSSVLNFKHKRQMFKNMCNKKTGDNLYNDDDPTVITKQFWTHIKANSKSCRLPETVRLMNCLRNKPIDEAEILNSYFFDQFCDPSN